jgi:DNA mismatch endonuclease (patch repair protein)
MKDSRTYTRDGRSPMPASERVSEQMSRIRGKDTRPERALRALLSAAGIRGYRLHWAKASGRPDVAFVGRKVAVFVHGCFWHGCPHCSPPRPKHNRGFWKAKLDRNAARDRRNTRQLRQAGWRVVTLWDCRLRKFPQAALRRVQRALADGQHR